MLLIYLCLQDFHPYYSTAKLQNVSQWYWQELEDDDKHQTLSDSPGNYRVRHSGVTCFSHLLVGWLVVLGLTAL